MAEKLTSLAWTAAKNSLTTTRAGDWQITGASMTQKHWQEFAGELLDSFHLFEGLLQGWAGWQISGASMTQKRQHEFAGELLDSFRIFEGSRQDSSG